jgi:ABC-type multidrug transport system fused ATPase/permease subunit
VDPIRLWIWHYLRPYRGRIAGLALLSCAEVGLRVLSPWPLKLVIDHVIGTQPMHPAARRALDPLAGLFAGWGARERMLWSIVVAGALVQVAHQVVMMFHSRVQAGTGHRMVRDLRERLFAHVQALTVSQHARSPMGESLYRLEADACCLEHIVLRGVFPIAFSALTLVAMFAVLVGIDVQLAFVSLAIVPLLYGWLRFYTGRMQPAASHAKACEAAMVQRLHESLGAIRLVKSYAREDHEQDRFSDAAGCALDARIVTTQQESLFAAVVIILTIGGTAVVTLIGGLSVLHGRISLGTLLLLIAYLGFVYGPLCGIANTTGALQQAVASARRVRETFALATEPTDRPGAVDPGRFHGEVVFEHVGFAYDGGHDVLEDVSFRVAPGQTVALVGMSGAGKSTIVSLIVRLYEPTRGRILIDGRDVRDYKLRALRRGVAVVLQEALALSGTIRENLRYGRLDATDAEVEAAARAAHAHDFIQEQMHGYDTVLGEAGSGLSGGQKQRLSIARAFLKDAPILVLDEPTAALDSISEELVFRGVRQLQQGRTTFVIAHRLSTVRAADAILLVDKGRIVAQGTHEELLASSPLYERMAAQLVATDAPLLARAG